MNEQDNWAGYEEYEREVAREALHIEADQWEDIQQLKQYINRLEAERDYYFDSSEFAGVPKLRRPKIALLTD